MFQSSVHIIFATYMCMAIMSCAGSVANACLWDIDTLQMERRRFPGTLEIITGKFVRHISAYYAWRIQDRLDDRESSSEDPAVVDDLAFAYAKLGRHSEGIAILTQVLESHPNRYETLANLGTLHMLAGDMKNGKEWLDRAIAVNASAHFWTRNLSVAARRVLADGKGHTSRSGARHVLAARCSGRDWVR